MSLVRLALRSLWFHWRGNLAVLLGIAVGAAVLTGALLVGDSLRGSLRQLTLERLGWVDQVLVANRFLREGLASDLGVSPTCPALLLRGAAGKATTGTGHPTQRRVGRVTILGLDERFWPAGEPPVGRDFWQGNSTKGQVVLNEALATALGVQAGDEVAFHLQKVRPVERGWLLGESNKDSEEEPTSSERVLEELTFTVRAILPDHDSAARFSLIPSPVAPRNALVPLRLLQDELHKSEGKANSLPEKPVNALFVQDGTKSELQKRFDSQFKLEDWGLILQDPTERARRLDRNGDGKLQRGEWMGLVPRSLAEQAGKDGVLSYAAVEQYYRQLGYVGLESRQQLLDQNVASAALKAARQAGLEAAPTLVYIANTIKVGKHEVPYSLVAALEVGRPPPLGPFLKLGEELQDDEILLSQWIADTMKQDGDPLPQPGAPVILTYFDPEDHGAGVPPKQATFRFRAWVPLEGVANDPDLTPQFPGITDTKSVRDWDPPRPFDRAEIQRRFKNRDDDYWKEHRTTPKAYVSLARGQELWGSRLGQMTSLRLAAKPASGTQSPLAPGPELLQEFRRHFQPDRSGLAFDDVKQRSLEASTGGTDFSILFLGFSTFLIGAALLLVALLVRLNFERRAAEIGLLLAAGFRPSVVRRLLLFEGVLLGLAGGTLGVLGALVYARLLLRLLAALWPGGADFSFLGLHVTWQSLAIGFGSVVILSLVIIAWAVHSLGRIPASALLGGAVTAESRMGAEQRPARFSIWLGRLSALGAICLLALGPFVQDHESKAMSFFGAGALLLTACLARVWVWMRQTRHGLVHGHGPKAYSLLAIRNAARHPLRSLLAAGLLAAATFVVLAVQSFHQEVDQGADDAHSGTGGFALLGESDVLINQDLNSAQGRRELRFPDSAAQTLEHTKFLPLRLQAGDDASCLNLYQPRRPRLLGVVPRLLEQRFRFAASEAKTPEEQKDPWLLLDKPLGEDEYPAIGDANTVQWMLKSKLGESIQVPDAKGVPRKLRIVALLEGSIFQSELILSESSFKKLYPDVQGYNVFLIDTPAGAAAAVQDLLNTTLAARGFEATATKDRLKAFLDVENTYLSTFQALGGLGLVLGTLGLTVVLLRSVWERRAELALLRALGYRKAILGWLVLGENSFLLFLGLAAGTLSALLAVAPYLTGGAAGVQWLQMIGLLGLAAVVGSIAALAALVGTLRAPLVPALRRE